MKASQGVGGNGYHLQTSQTEEVRSYSLKRWVKGVCLLLAAACFVFGCLLYVDWKALPWLESLNIQTGAAGLILMGIYLCLGAFQYRVLLDQDSVTVKGVFRAPSLRRDEVKGRRTFRNRNGEYTVLEPKELDGKILTISNFFDLDQAWFDWVGSLPDLDAEDLDALLKEIAESKARGKTSY
jgi:hypothetical protein